MGLKFALKKGVKRVKAGLRAGLGPGLAMRSQAASEPISGGNKPAASCPQAGWAAARALQTIADFAPALIAAKPVKPCDGGVFRA